MDSSVPLEGKLKELEKKIKQAILPADLTEKLEEELSVLRGSLRSDATAASGLFINFENFSKYINCILSLPFNKETKDILDLTLAKTILDKNHYGLPSVKNVILEYLSTLILNINNQNISRSPIICLVGLVGTGKTTYAKRLANKLKARYIDVNKIIKENNISEGYDKKRKCEIVDIKKLNKVLEKIIKESKESLVIDSHMSHFLSPRLVDYVVITKTSLKKLKNRLKKRGYSKSKIDENLEVEIMDICLNEARELGHKVKIVNTYLPKRLSLP